MTNHTGVQVPEAAVEAAAREEWMRVRVWDANTKGRASDLAPWDHLYPEVREQKLHEARQNLQAALPAIYEDFKERLAALNPWTDVYIRVAEMCPDPTPCPRCIVSGALAAAFPQQDPGGEKR